MSSRQFIDETNIHTIWEVISDEDIFRFLNRDAQQNIYELFISNIQGFYENEKKTTKLLVDINKKYILLILNYIKQNYPFQPNKIKISGDALNDSITYEEIHNDHKTQINKDYIRREEEFKDMMEIKPPPVPDFSYKEKDEPIKDMDKILREMQQKRNYDIEKINNLNDNNNDNNDWVQPKKTSLKPEINEESQVMENFSKTKFVNLDNNIDDSPKLKKNVSFNDIEEVNTFDENEEVNLFSKLKKINNNFSNINDNEERINMLEKEILVMNNKIDKIIHLLEDKF